MTKESDDYEKLIASLIENVKNSGRDIRNIGYGKSNFLVGHSGQKHQIDVSFTDYSFPVPTLILIECKRWKDPVDVSVPKILKYNNDDIIKNPEYSDQSKMIIVTSSNFQSGAKKIADYENIIIQIVNHEPPYGFSYENIIQYAVADSVKIRDKVFIKISKA